MNTARAADSCTILQAHQVPAAGDLSTSWPDLGVGAVTFIEERDGSIGVFRNETGKRLGSLVKDAAQRSRFSGFWIGALFGFSWASTIAIVTCWHWLPLHA